MIILRRSPEGDVRFARVARFLRLQDPYPDHFSWLERPENATHFDDNGVANHIATVLNSRGSGHEYIASQLSVDRS